MGHRTLDDLLDLAFDAQEVAVTLRLSHDPRRWPEIYARELIAVLREREAARQG